MTGATSPRRVGRLSGLGFLLMLTLAGARSLEAQLVVEVPPPGALQEMVLLDGSTLYGRVEATGDPVVFVTVAGARVEVERAQIYTLVLVERTVREGELWNPDPHDSRLFFGPTGRTLRAKSGSFGVFQILAPFLTVAPTDDIMISVGTPLIETGSERPVWLAPKVRVHSSERLDLSVGALGVFLLGDGDAESIGIAFGSATYGTEDAALTLGVGYGWVEDDLAERPAILAGGELRIARSVKLLSENYLFPEEGGIASIGVRFIGERLSADVGLARPVFFDDDDGTFVFPVVNFAYSW